MEVRHKVEEKEKKILSSKSGAIGQSCFRSRPQKPESGLPTNTTGMNNRITARAGRGQPLRNSFYNRPPIILERTVIKFPANETHEEIKFARRDLCETKQDLDVVDTSNITTLVQSLNSLG